MEELKHFSHKHPLILSKYDDNSPADALCCGCGEPIIINTYVYRCSTPRVNTEQDSSCTRYLLHKSCSILPPFVQHDLHIQHMLRLQSIYDNYIICCNSCEVYFYHIQFCYRCSSCHFTICIKCSSPERDLNHASHNHTLTLFPLKFSHFCGACGTKGSEDFSYLCKTCLFCIHKSCASAPPQLTCKAHHNDHPLVLDYSLPEAYQRFGGVSCSLCRERVNSYLWIYYCADCRYFAHVKCALSATESGEDSNDDVGDAEDADLLHFPISDDKPFLLYQLIQKFAEKFSASTDERSAKADKISHCRNGHLLVLFDDFNNKNDAESESRDRMICDGCVQPIQSPPDSFYGCLDCNFFLHSICAAELPRDFEHASHPEHKLVRCDQISKPNVLLHCHFCGDFSNGIFYSCDSCSIRIDLVCAAMPSEIRHNSHKHKLKYKHWYGDCDGCYFSHSSNYRCEICNYQIHIGCAREAGKIKHRWDEHQLDLMYPPVKGHPHDFNCERCSEDINPNYRFYHCRKCDTSFHAECLDQGCWANIKFGAILKDDTLHQHGLKITPAGAGPKFKCGSCGIVKADTYGLPCLKCVSCKFSVCHDCSTVVLW